MFVCLGEDEDSPQWAAGLLQERSPPQICASGRAVCRAIGILAGNVVKLCICSTALIGDI